MSIATQISALQTDKTNIYNAISAQGGTVASGDGFDDFASKIATIPVAKPIDVSTDSGMAAVMVTENVGKCYRFTGTTGTYVNGDLYIVKDTQQEPYIGDMRFIYVGGMVRFTLGQCGFDLQDGTEFAYAPTITKTNITSSMTGILDLSGIGFNMAVGGEVHTFTASSSSQGAIIQGMLDIRLVLESQYGIGILMNITDSGVSVAVSSSLSGYSFAETSESEYAFVLPYVSM